MSTLSSIFVHNTVHEALFDPWWKKAIVDEMFALDVNGTWELVSLPPGHSTVGCQWIYTIKIGSDGKVNRLKAWLIAKDYT